jgi:hypothetical protein
MTENSSGFNFGQIPGSSILSAPTGFNFGSQNVTGLGGIFLSAQAPQTQSVPEPTVTNPKAWIGILAHSSYHDLQEMSMHGKKIDTILIASLGSCSKMEIQPTATAFNDIASKNALESSPHKILQQFNDVVKIKITPEEEEEGQRISPEKLANYRTWIHDPGMTSSNKDVYYEKWYNFTYGFKYDGFLKVYIELDGRPQVINIPISQIPGYPTPTKTQLLQHIFSLYPALQEITFIDLCCSKLAQGMTPQHFKPGILGGKKLILEKRKICKDGSHSVSTQNRHRSRSRCTRHVHRSHSTRRISKLGRRKR